MQCRYECALVARCPVDDRSDTYLAIFETDRKILVEEILAEVKLWHEKAEFQEEIATALAEHFKCKVTLIGDHSGVKATVTAP
jgi:hypothetical protein